VNAIVATQKSPPFSVMISRLFSSDIDKILEKYTAGGKSGGSGLKSSANRFKK